MSDAVTWQCLCHRNAYTRLHFAEPVTLWSWCIHNLIQLLSFSSRIAILRVGFWTILFRHCTLSWWLCPFGRQNFNVWWTLIWLKKVVIFSRSFALHRGELDDLCCRWCELLFGDARHTLIDALYIPFPILLCNLTIPCTCLIWDAFHYWPWWVVLEVSTTVCLWYLTTYFCGFHFLLLLWLQFWYRNLELLCTVPFKIPFWLLIASCAASIQYWVFFFWLLLFHCQLLSRALLKSRCLWLIRSFLVDGLTQRCCKVRVPNRVGTTNIAAVASIKQVDLCFLHYRYLPLPAFLFVHNFSTLVHILLVAWRRVLWENLDFWWSPCWLIVR